jgi:ATP-dependent RNA helicase DHX8/PRP22
LLIIK